ncbi:MAG: family 10 glycosylhydrolase, partial [Clostridiaceae bacterium]|nr:family 10 glycosylhydrolase [Clostridiaceae bacterium]
PYRITKKTSKEPKHDLASLDPSNPARSKPEWVVKHTDGNLYYNPGIPEVRKLVIDGVLEIIENYDIDGIHLDDYFYPGKDFNDKAAYAKYGTAYGNIDDWRRANVNKLISELSKAVKSTGKAVSLGVSPFGIWANKSANTLGSDTRGTQSYYDQYADTRKWVKEGLLDYIAPQLYWHIGYEIADYSRLLNWWADVTAGTGVDLYIGQAAYRTGDTDLKSPWYGIAEMEKQLQLNSESKEVKGSIFFSNRSLCNNPALSAAIKSVYKKKSSVPVSVSLPAEDIQTTLKNYYLNGSSDPEKPLYLNGVPVENRSARGYFGVLVPLAEGANSFTLSQEASEVTRVIYKKTAASGLAKMSEAEIIPASVFPQSQEYRNPGEKITLSCKAPYGSKVTVQIGGKSYSMKPSGAAAGASGLYADKFSYEYTIPAYNGTPRNIDLGGPVYTMNYKGTVKSLTAPAKVGVIMKGSPFYAKVEKEVINTYNKAGSSDGAAYELYSGMVDSVTGMSGGYVRLSLGQWVKDSDVAVYTSKGQSRPVIKNTEYISGDWWDSLKLDISTPPAAIADFDGALLKIDIAAGSQAAAPELPDNSPFSSVTVVKTGNNTEYTMTLKESRSISGYYIQKTKTGLVLNIKRPVKSNNSNQPLSGLTIMLDPGHGGSDPGAIGPLGTEYAEKTINLNFAFKLQSELERLGARVLLTRAADVNVSLDERLTASRNAKPDMFISLHANSMAEDVDISKVDGFSVFYREKLALPLAETVFRNTLADLSRTNKGLHNRNFYVTRGTWTPSILVESGFVPNPYEFEWLIDENEQTGLAQSIAESVVGYFK